MGRDCCIFNCPNKRTNKKHSQNQVQEANSHVDLDIDIATDLDLGLEEDNKDNIDLQLQKSGSKAELKVKLWTQSQSDIDLDGSTRKPVKYHGFPLKLLDRLEQWVKICLPHVKPQRDIWQVTVHTRICSEHFLPEDYRDVDKPDQLKYSAVPTIFLTDPVNENHKQTVDGLPIWVRICDQAIADPRNGNLKRRFYSPVPIKGETAYCRALGCGNSMENMDTQELMFHRFPWSDPVLLEKWARAVGIKDFTPASHWILCGVHFARDCYRINKNNRRVLKPTAVPTLFKLPGPELMHLVDLSAPYLQPCVVLRGLNDPEPIKRPEPQEEMEGVPQPPEQEEDMDISEPVDVAVIGTIHDHKYIKTEDDDEKEIAAFKTILEELKDKVMSASQKVKSLKISVSALKYQYQLEQRSLNSNEPIRK